MAVDITALAADRDLTALWTAVHERMCAGRHPATIARVRVVGLSSVGLATLRTWVDTSTRRRRDKSAVVSNGDVTIVPLRDVLTALGLSAEDLQELVEAAVGRPVVDLAAARRATSAQRRGFWADVEEALPSLPRLVARMRAAGTDDEASVRRLAGALAQVVSRLPRTPPTSLAKLSLDCAGDPHYFDLDRLAGTRLVAAVAELTGVPEPRRPDLVRAMLTEAGILADRLSATVLLHQVRVRGTGPVDTRLRDATTPVALTLLDLTVHPPKFAPQVLTVVENPSVLEAAMAHGSRQAFACTSGHLGSVDHALLQLAVDHGVSLRYAGDLDGPGLHIAKVVAETYGAQLVAMSAATVEQAGPEPSAVPLGEPPVWLEQGLSDALRLSGRVLYQEHDAVLRSLFTDG
ncbi:MULTISPECIES: TIGR02679 domain-containing protein [unclassified Saccharothrix]|uniref:TIGR02679 domain-containing protein n=1 Tax=unclassified Saccharothrix TaxID=2593673 RepID=UPI00307D76E1